MLYLPEITSKGQQSITLDLEKRLPDFLTLPCRLTVRYNAERRDDYYLLHLLVSGDLKLVCQRCSNDYILNYNNATSLAVCRNDERAESLSGQYECITATNWRVDLEHLVVDDLHLYAPRYHKEEAACDNKINQLLTEKNSS